MKKRLVLIVLIAIPLLFLFLLYQTSDIRYLLTPPSDLYDALCLKEIDLSKSGSVYECDFANKYKGSHTIGIITEPALDITKNPDWTIKVKVEVYDGASVILSKVVSEPYYLFLGGHFSKGGFALIGYEAPDTLPLHKQLKCKLEIIMGDKVFKNKYSKASMYVAKASDK
jgi:hypothetical protein